MDFTVVSSTCVEQFFQREKEEARAWLRSEMDTLLNVLFDRMRTKFVDSMNFSILIDKGSDNESTITPVGSAVTTTIAELPPKSELSSESSIDDEKLPKLQQQVAMNSYNQNSIIAEPGYSQFVNFSENDFHPVKREIKSETEPLIIDSGLLSIDSMNDLFEFDDQLFTSEPDALLSSPTVLNNIPSVEASTSTKLPPFDSLLPTTSSNDPCEKCNNNNNDLMMMTMRMEEGKAKCNDHEKIPINNNESYQNEQHSRQDMPAPSKRTRAEENETINTPENRTSAKPTTPPKKKLATKRLKCTVDPNCQELFPDRISLNLHVFNVHGERAHQCYQQGCGQAFAKSEELTAHIQKDHASTGQWNCFQCGNPCKSYTILCRHVLNMHKEGEFHCAIPECTFTATTRKAIYNHCEVNHQEYKFPCQFDGCLKVFKKRCDLNSHHRYHGNLKQYKCRWPDCQFESKSQSNTLRHIRTQHLNLPRNKRDQILQDIPTEFDPKLFCEKIEMPTTQIVLNE